MNPIRVYIAGPLTPKGIWNKNPAIDYLYNCREMLLWGLKIWKAGFVPFTPCLDLLYFLVPGVEITEEMIKDHSMRWMEVCDAVFVMPKWEKSDGTKKEISKAMNLNIRIFYDMKELCQYFKRCQNEPIKDFQEPAGDYLVEDMGQVRLWRNEYNLNNNGKEEKCLISPIKNEENR